MGSTYNFRKMKPNLQYFRNSHVAGTNDNHYRSASFYVYSLGWLRFRKRCREDYQRSLLRALAVTGTIPEDWNRIFDSAADGKPPFQDLDRRAYKGEILDPFDYFMEKLGREGKWRVHYPPLCPEWLLAYEYAQEDYLVDLEEYWENVDNSYYRPWSTRRIGEDSPEVARLKLLGTVAREEIDEVARQAGLYAKH